ncbi:diaminopimelate epimerase [Jeotgalibacillus sp. R-1-5s-1]|uniref:diaminopimelate epimerase n=1 Tax=Jeotgalibacillus sp. R-1-5s-1 TaxID=2555897 RepID=UPI00106A76BE|nr:diaminopimelate epimerase [Jeotgalibacillus sp. R-1-5s-1]TFE03306.1 diaminopimelate epimerase [Jeotgalibacillus sp. R-1-5s-1]
MLMKLVKSHGSLNDFIIIDEKTLSIPLTDDLRESWAVTLCDRKQSIGADGILYMSDSQRAHTKMRVFNSDGSEASMCGNGLRCAARYIAERDGIDSFDVETMKATLHVQKEKPLSHDVPTYSVEISPVLFNLESLPLELDQDVLINEKVAEWGTELSFTAVAVPNPHLITVTDTEMINGGLQEKLASAFNQDNPWFTDGVNVSFVVKMGDGEFFVRTYERGVGFTNACGTAMSSSSLVQVLLGECQPGEPVTIYNDGGQVRCIVNRQEDQYTHINLIGNATFSHIAEVELQENGEVKVISITETDENGKYAEMAEASRSSVLKKLPELKLKM